MMSVRSAESDIRSAQSRVTQLSNQLASYEKQGLKSDAERTRGFLEQAKADLARANARLVSETQKETQAKADAAAERRHREEVELQREIAAENARATKEAALIEARAIAEAENKRELARIDAERKAYVADLSDKELLKLTKAIEEKSYMKMMKESAEEIIIHSDKQVELTSNARQQAEIEIKIKEEEKKLNPKFNKGPIIILSIVGAVVGMILAPIIRNSIIKSCPFLWVNSYSDGISIRYEVSNGVSTGVYWIVVLIIVAVFLCFSLIKQKKKYSKAMSKVSEAEKKIKEFNKDLSQLKKEGEKLQKQLEEIIANEKYDIDNVIKVSNEIQWKAEYAEQEYNKRHYTDMSVDDIVSKVKK